MQVFSSEVEPTSREHTCGKPTTIQDLLSRPMHECSCCAETNKQSDALSMPHAGARAW